MKAIRALLGVALVFSGQAFAVNNSGLDVVNKNIHNWTDVLEQGETNLSFRARVERAHVSGSPLGEAHTVKTTFRYSTPYVQSFAGLIEFNGVTGFFPGKHNPGLSIRSSKVNRPEIADPSGATFHRAFLSYNGFDDTVIVGGRQYIELDNGRFVSNYPFRQSPTTFDAISFTNRSVDDLEFFYAYFWQVNTPYANATVPLASRRNYSHLINASYKGLPFGSIIGYAYLINDKDLNTNSSRTAGARFSDTRALENMKFSYHLEYALQKSAYNNPVGYTGKYYHFGFNNQFTSVGPVEAFNILGGYEILTGDSRSVSKQFRTPLANLHEFQGMVGKFTTIPNSGIRDIYLGTSVDYEGLLGKVMYHRFKPESGSGRLGYEWDFTLDKQLDEHYSAGVGLATFVGNSRNNTRNSNRMWLSLSASL